MPAINRVRDLIATALVNGFTAGCGCVTGRGEDGADRLRRHLRAVARPGHRQEGGSGLRRSQQTPAFAREDHRPTTLDVRQLLGPDPSSLAVPYSAEAVRRARQPMAHHFHELRPDGLCQRLTPASDGNGFSRGVWWPNGRLDF